MNEKEMIEEMAKWLDELWVDYPPTPTEVAEALIKNNFIQLPKGSVVLSKAEYEILAIEYKRWEKLAIEDMLHQARKETAKEIIKNFALSPRTRAMIANKYGLSKDNLEDI